MRPNRNSHVATNSNSKPTVSRNRTAVLHPDLRSMIGIPARFFSYFGSGSLRTPAQLKASVSDKPPICTADELHHVSVHSSDWRLALWRYKPPLKAPKRNHPLLLLSGVGTNAVGFDLSPGSSFARYMSGQGFDTWIMEPRGAGLSTEGVRSSEVEESVKTISKQGLAIKHEKDGACSVKQPSQINSDAFPESEASLARSDKSRKTRLTETIMGLSERLSGFLNEGLLEGKQNSAISSQITDLSQKLINIIEEGQESVSPQFIDFTEWFATRVEDLRKQLELIVKYNWDFDHYLEDDVPSVMEYIKARCKPKYGRLLAVGHSLGGILLYAMLSQNGSKGRDAGLAGIVTLGSSLDYTTSRSSLKLLLPLADPAQTFNVPIIPMGSLLAAAYPFASRPPYVLSWLNIQISAENMMHPDLFEKLVLNNFCTVPAKLLLQLTTAFQKGGLCDRSGTFFYKDHLCKTNVPVLALAGDQDRICPPDAVFETVKLMPKHLVTYKVFGEPSGPHYAHYDLVGSRLAAEQVYPFIIKFLTQHDMNNLP